MTNARLQEETGAVLTMPGGHVNGTASSSRDTSPRHLRAVINKHTARVYGGSVYDLLVTVGCPKVYDRHLKAWTVSVNRLDDVLAYAEFKQRRLITVEVLR